MCVCVCVCERLRVWTIMCDLLMHTYVAVCCSVYTLLQCVVHVCLTQRRTHCCSVLQCVHTVAVCCSCVPYSCTHMLQCVAVCFQRVAACCSVPYSCTHEKMLRTILMIYTLTHAQRQRCAPYACPPPDPMNHAKKFKGWSPRDAPSKPVPQW